MATNIIKKNTVVGTDAQIQDRYENDPIGTVYLSTTPYNFATEAYVQSYHDTTKQDKLIAGTNITIVDNVISASGGGGGSAAWGQITGTLSDQTDLNNALNGKQATIDANNKLSASYVSGLASVATSGSYNDLSNKPTIPVDTNTWRPVKVNGTQVLDGQISGNSLDLVAGTGVTLTESGGAVTIAASGGGGSTMYRHTITLVLDQTYVMEIYNTSSSPMSKTDLDTWFNNKAYSTTTSGTMGTDMFPVMAYKRISSSNMEPTLLWRALDTGQYYFTHFTAQDPNVPFEATGYYNISAAKDAVIAA